ncbi:MAG: hypothetical protein MUC90_00765 [Thermoplasmata archaeon]|nr:hypothetical protein [Thermoplasmata archaeon]
MATEFELEFKGSTKELLDAISILAEHNINLNTVATAKVDGRYVVKFLTGSEEEVRRMLMKAGLQYRDRQVMVVRVFNKPGQWLRVARSLVESGIEINASYLLGQKDDSMSFVFVVSDYEKARSVCMRVAECSID